MENKAKNPYQLRYDVLEMSKEILDRAYDTNLQIAHRAMDLAAANQVDALSAWEKYVPKMYTPEEIKKNAEMLYEFVTKKD